ncbi:peptidase [Leptolyngbya sp. FACHB-671]|uniref:peptidase n=1 Tax=Leptolyngbya sp. FACHB-671 TaxID=2692812 RepID=UPI0016898DB7|nr:peptidase [Leptolyngbya sp. FACHB-671]MBD2067649.1 peptidase [Leptolyngbya sp. FACHB-671]
MRLSSAFRRYHRQLAIVMCLPLALTIISGMAYPIFSEWLSLNSVAGFLVQVHSGRIFGLQGIYPLLNGLGLAGLLVTGMSMTSLSRQRSMKDTLSGSRSKKVAPDYIER